MTGDKPDGAVQPSSSFPLGVRAHDLLPDVYEDLRRLAAYRIASMAPGQTLQATALVHEAWLRLSARDRQWQGRTHFFATAADVIRNIVVDHVRGKARLKRGGGQLRLNIDEIDVADATPDEKVLLIDEALAHLNIEHPDKARVVVLKFFGGLTDREAAESLGITERTIERHWAYAKAWLLQYIREHGHNSCRVLPPNVE
jgi:RNA polymerase sigma factor (TIGR02999 family)